MAEDSQLAKDVKELGSQVAQLQEVWKADKVERKLELESLAVRMQEMIQDNNKQLAQLFGIQSQQGNLVAQPHPQQGLGCNIGATNGGADQGAMGGRIGQNSYAGAYSFSEGATFNDGIHTRSMKFDFPKFDGE